MEMWVRPMFGARTAMEVVHDGTFHRMALLGPCFRAWVRYCADGCRRSLVMGCGDCWFCFLSRMMFLSGFFLSGFFRE